MIDQLRIRGLGVIDDAVISLSPGLTAITGETGAGKTMVLTGLALLAGGRPDAALVRNGAAAAWVDGEWRLPPDHAVVTRLTDAGSVCEADADGAVIALLGRTIAAEGRSRALAGGRTVPAAVLQEISPLLLAVHGQADQAHLRSAEAQRELLDRFGGAPVLEARAEVRALIEEWRALHGEWQSLGEEAAARAREASLLMHGIAEIDAVDPQPGEDAELDRAAAVLQHAGALLELVQTAHDALVGSDAEPADSSALTAAATALRALERAAEVDASVLDMRDRVRDIQAIATDVATELAAYAASVDADPARQAWVEERRAQLSGLRRRYGSTLDEVLHWRESAQKTVAAVEGAPERLAWLQQRIAELEVSARTAVDRLSERRRTAAQSLSRAVTAELVALAMADAAVEVEVSSSPEASTWTLAGADRVEFLLRAHRGGALRPLAKSASGGELSRVMLAVEVVLAGVDPVPTFVFDEVDAGIGGRAAVEVGRRLARLARTAQVIVVTHLPQVAAFADSHVVVAKGSDGLVTEASVREVEGEERVTELVRMLSGLDGSESGAAHAQELLTLAREERGGRAEPGASSVTGRRRR